MFEHGGVWLPDGEAHLGQWMDTRNERDADGRLTYQHHKLQRALELTPLRGCAVDVGAHVGLWSMYLGQLFQTVHAFEPILEHVDCFMCNCAGLTPIQLHEYALGNRKHRVQMHTEPTSSGDSYPLANSTGNTSVEVYDDIGIDSVVDLVKLDCEGYELFALEGMEQMLLRDHPTVVVEQKPGKAQKYGLRQTQAVDYLETLGARVVCAMSGDYFLAWP